MRQRTLNKIMIERINEDFLLDVQDIRNPRTTNDVFRLVKFVNIFISLFENLTTFLESLKPKVWTEERLYSRSSG